MRRRAYRAVAVACWLLAWSAALAGRHLDRDAFAADGWSPWAGPLVYGPVVVLALLARFEGRTWWGFVVVLIPVYGAIVSFGVLWRLAGRAAAGTPLARPLPTVAELEREIELRRTSGEDPAFRLVPRERRRPF